jgi:hypothetical protein
MSRSSGKFSNDSSRSGFEPIRRRIASTPMPFPVTALEKKVLAILTLLIVLGLIGLAIL